MSILVFDNGSGFTKAGVAGDTTPKVVFPTVVTPDQKDSYVGSKAQEKRDVLSLTYPIERGLVKSWDDLEKIWHHTYSELQMISEEQPVLLTEAPLMPAADREKMVQIMFETFKVPSMSLAIDALLALYAAGLTDGVVLDSGYGVTSVVPCSKGFAIPEAILRLDLAGSDLTNYLSKILNERGYTFATADTHDAVHEIKEKLCYVATDFENEVKMADSGTSIDENYELPDGKVITVGSERFQCPEALFKPELAGVQSDGIHKLLSDSIMKNDAGLHETMYGNIVISSGNTLFPGIAARLEKELKGLAPQGTAVNVIAPATRQHSVWIGGSILAALPTFKDVLITKQAYEETGPSIASRIE